MKEVKEEEERRERRILRQVGMVGGKMVEGKITKSGYGGLEVVGERSGGEECAGWWRGREGKREDKLGRR